MLLDWHMAFLPLNIVWRRQALVMVLKLSFLRSFLLFKINRPLRWIAIQKIKGLPMMDELVD